jgi:environmental stress-induced protein Ves
MKINIKRKAEQKPTKWSGGTTTELAIFPETSSYSERNFNYRISSAQVEDEESVFTKLPGVSREIMILEGELELFHKNKYSKYLKTFDTDSFSGEWDTSSKGKVTDFNLMTMGNTSGKIEAISLKNDVKYNIIKKSEASEIALYLFSGSAEISTENDVFTLNEKDFCIISESQFTKLEINTISDCTIIKTEIFRS